MDTARPKLLFLAQTLPFPADGGVKIRTYNVLRLLARSFDITALCFYRSATSQSLADIDAAVQALREFADVSAFPIPQEQSSVRLVWDHVRSLVTRRPYTVYSYESESFRARLEEVLRSQSFDLAHMDSLDLSGYLPLLNGYPVVCVHHNVESALLRRRAKSEQPLQGQYIAHQADLMEQEEREWVGRVALNVVVSLDDGRRLKELVPSASCAVVPNGVDTGFFQPGPAAETGIVFVGGYSWYPNRDALEHFSANILPLLRSEEKDVPVQWVGRAPEAVRLDCRDHHAIELTGYVDDIRPYVHNAACYVVPLRVGGGTRLKILDAWAMGKAVVSTSVGCEGLDARDGENILIRDDPAEFAAAICSVLRDKTLRTQLGEGARLTASAVYDWDVIGESMIRHYRSILDDYEVGRNLDQTTHSIGA